MSDIKYAVFNKTETVRESVYKDFVTFSLLIFCIYISQDSTWWTFVTGICFLLAVFGKISSLMKRYHQFKNKDELQEWVNSLD